MAEQCRGDHHGGRGSAQLASIAYVKTGCGQTDCTLYAESVTTTAHGQRRDGTSTLSAQTYGYDAAGRLSTVKDTVAGVCVNRVYAFDGTSGKASNRTGFATYAPDGSGACQTTTAASSRSYTYDTADRITTTGTVYDALGRTTTLAAADTSIPANGNATISYHANDMVKSITQSGRTSDYTLDVVTDRHRVWIDNASGGALTKTSHYVSDSDGAAWTDEGNGTWTRTVGDTTAIAAVQTGPTSRGVHGISLPVASPDTRKVPESTLRSISRATGESTI